MLRKWFLKKELKFWKYQLESLANDIEYSNDSKLIKDNMYSRYCKYEKVVNILEDLLMNNI
jgi:hypothetical protein